MHVGSSESLRRSLSAIKRQALLQEAQMLSHQLQSRHHGDEQRLRTRGVVPSREELFEQLPLTFHA
jgi:hypothetical protein